MDLAWLEDFLALVECGSFSEAAERRHLSQPAFSRRIRSLEEWAGVDLVDRSTHRISLTAAGAAFQPLAEEAMRRLADARRRAQDVEREKTSGIRLACTHLLASAYFPRWLASVEPELGRQVSFQLLVDNMVACERLMRSGEAKLLLCHHHPAAPAELDARAFIRLRLAGDCLLAVSAPDANGRPLYNLPLERRLATPYLAYREESGLGRILARSGVLERLGGRLDPVFHSHAALTLVTLARSGKGLAWAPLSLVRDDLEAEALVKVGTADVEIQFDVCLIRPVARQSATVEALWSLVNAPIEAKPSGVRQQRPPC
jgi:DNA-binding transcriptional LysR family regulator